MRTSCCPPTQFGLLIIGMASALSGSGDATLSTPSPVPRYAVVDLGVIARLAADIIPGLSSSGKIVTWRQGDAETFTAVLFEGASEKVLRPPVGYRNSFAYSVNDRGNSVGWSNTTANPVDSASTVHATFFGKQGALDLGTLGGLRSRAYAINNRDVVVGVSELENKDQRAFRYVGGRMQALDVLAGGGYSVAFDINDAGTIVGGSGIPSISKKPLVHAVLWRGSNPKDLGTLDGAGSSIAYAINRHDEVTGVSDLRGEETVFLYSQGKMSDLGIRGHAFAINDSRKIVGTLEPTGRGRPRGFLWENGVVRDINTLIPGGTYQIEAAYRINDRGQILCSGAGNGHLHVLLLNPAGRSKKEGPSGSPENQLAR
jgi:probable HAF family extracellular repeat protein